MSKKPTAKRKPSLPKLSDTRELCSQLAIMAGLIEDRRVAEKIYKAVRQLQLLDKLAIEAGLLPKKDDNG